MRADTEHGFTSVAASLSKETLWHADDDKPPLRSGDDDDYPIPNRHVIKKPRFLMRGDIADVIRRSHNFALFLRQKP